MEINPVNTPFNYTGNKFNLLPQLLPHFDYTSKIFIDVFAGGGSVYTNVIDKYEKIIVNDIIKDLVECHKLLIEIWGFKDLVKSYCPAYDNQTAYLQLREWYNNNPSPEKLFALMLSCTNNMLRFNKQFKFNQTFGKRTYNSHTEEKIEKFIEHITPYKNKIEYKSVEFNLVCDDIEKIQQSMFYFDPPYYGTSAGYNNYWSKKHEEELFNYIRFIDKHRGSFVLSGIKGEHKNKPQSTIITRLIELGYNVIELDYKYQKVSRNKTSQLGTEIIIKNY